MPQPYHHGNLREALLQAALQLIAELGPAGFTLREVARRAGVSHNAPYRHFPNKDELLAAVAAQGFHELTEAMMDAAQAGSNALERLQRSGWAYVAFALRRPEHFTVMFDAPLAKSTNPKSTEAGEKAFGALVAAVEACQQEGQLPPGETMARALVAWSLVHGISKLAIAQRLPFRSSAAVLKFAEIAIQASMPSLAWRGS
ncbi:MAG TPA: TetR/AcrR family transcriptional regulator [Bryobacteraceae bacterium]|nr:TetR/AcrR family transcriptional regulator [Bryobacteraceae bacterium]